MSGHMERHMMLLTLVLAMHEWDNMSLIKRHKMLLTLVLAMQEWDMISLKKMPKMLLTLVLASGHARVGHDISHEEAQDAPHLGDGHA